MKKIVLSCLVILTPTLSMATKIAYCPKSIICYENTCHATIDVQGVVWKHISTFYGEPGYQKIEGVYPLLKARYHNDGYANCYYAAEDAADELPVMTYQASKWKKKHNSYVTIDLKYYPAPHWITEDGQKYECRPFSHDTKFCPFKQP